MLKSNYIKFLAIVSGLTLATAAGAQVVLGSFQSAGDPNNTGWVDTQNSDPIATDPNCAFINAGVPGYTSSLVAGGPGGFGHPQLVLSLSPAQIAAFNTNSWLTFTFSIPNGTYTGGYSQLYNLAFNASGYGYNNQNWANALEMGNTNNTTPGTMPNYYLNSGSNALESMVVSMNYSTVTNAIITGGEGFFQMTFQFNNGGGAPTNIILNNVFLSKSAFGAGIRASNVYVIDDFSTNGVGPENPTNDDWFAGTNIYNQGAITNVWDDWFGGALNNTNVYWSALDANSNSASGSMQLLLNFGGGNQFVLHHVGYAQQPNVSSLTYTALVADVRWDPSSVTNVVATGANYGPLRFGIRPTSGGGGGQDWFYTTNVPAGNTNWVHLVMPLPNNNPDYTTSWGELLVGMDTTIGGWNGSGNSTLYIDNLSLVGPLATVVVPPPTVNILPSRPGLRIFAGSAVNTFDRATISTVSENESWIGGSFPVTYSFSLLSYPNNNINQTMVEIMPINTITNSLSYLGGAFPAGGNQYFDYQNSNGMWLVLAPNGGGAVTASVQWKTNSPNANPQWNALVITNPTAIGTWTWTFNSANSGTLTAPGANPVAFTITDATVTADFANPAAVAFGLQPNSTAGEGLFEDWGSVGITGVAGGSISENWTSQSVDFSSGTSPDGKFSAQGSANPTEIIISRSGLDSYWINWTTPSVGYQLVTGTNIQSQPVSQWISPQFYSQYDDETAPRGGSPVLLASKYWTLMPQDDLPTIDGHAQASPPTVNDPLAPNAYFMLTTNIANIFP